MTGRALILVALLAAAGSPPAAFGATPSGFHGTGTLVAAATIAGTPVNVGGQIAVFASGSQYRLDVLSLGFPSAGAAAGTLAGALIAPGGVTLLYNGDTGMVGAYSNGSHTFYSGAPKRPVAAGAAPPGPAGFSLHTGASDPLATLALVARQLQDVTSAALQLTGHSSTNGHPTADFDVLVKRQRPGHPREDYHAQLSLADDLDGFPVRIALSSTPPTPQDIGGSARLDLTAVAREDIAAGVFAIPAGYSRVDSLGDVLQARSSLPR